MSSYISQNKSCEFLTGFRFNYAIDKVDNTEKTILQVQSSLAGLKYMGVIAVGVHASRIEKRNP